MGENESVLISIYYIDMEGKVLQDFGRVFGNEKNWFMGALADTGNNE